MNYKAQTSLKNSNFDFAFTAIFDINPSSTTPNCSTTELPFGCVTKINSIPNYNTEYHISFNQEGKLNSRSTTNSAGNLVFNESRTHNSESKLSSQTFRYFNNDGKLINRISNSFDNRERITRILKNNASSNIYYREKRKYHNNNKIAERTFAYLSGDISNKIKAAYYYKYNSIGTKQVYKRMYHNSDGYVTKMSTYVYNTKGQLKSNKYGKAYKYVTYFKKKSLLPSKIYKAKYSSKGKRGKGYRSAGTSIAYYTYSGE